MICRQNKACVQCVAYGTGELKGNCPECKARDYISVQNVLPGILKNEKQKIPYRSNRSKVIETQEKSILLLTRIYITTGVHGLERSLQ